MTRRRSIMDKTVFAIASRICPSRARRYERVPRIYPFPDRSLYFVGWSAATYVATAMAVASDASSVDEGNCRDPILMDNGIIGYGRNSPWGWS